MVSDEHAEAAAVMAGDMADAERAVRARRRLTTRDELAAFLHGLDEEVRGTCSVRGLVGQAADALVKDAQEGTCTAESVRRAFESILARRVVQWHVLRPVMGAQSETDDFLDFGATRVWTLSALHDHLRDKVPDDRADGLFPVHDGLVAHVTVPARDAHAGLAAGDTRLVEFESILRYIGGVGHWDPGVFTHQPESNRFYAAASELGILTGGSADGAVLPFDLDDEHLLGDDYNSAADLWILHAKETRSGVENKLLMGVHWLSRSKRETDPALSLTQCCFGLEAALPHSGYGPRPEFIADLLSTRQEDRDHFKARARAMFEARNEVAHGDRVTLDPEIREEALRMSSAVYGNLLMPALREAPTETAFAQAIRDGAAR